jgi:hypothetical protein
MGRVPIWKLPDLTHKILLGKERKERKNHGGGQREEERDTNGSEDQSRREEHVRLSGSEEN